MGRRTRNPLPSDFRVSHTWCCLYYFLLLFLYKKKKRSNWKTVPLSKPCCIRNLSICIWIMNTLKNASTLFLFSIHSYVCVFLSCILGVFWSLCINIKTRAAVLLRRAHRYSPPHPHSGLWVFSVDREGLFHTVTPSIEGLTIAPLSLKPVMASLGFAFTPKFQAIMKSLYTDWFTPRKQKT